MASQKKEDELVQQQAEKVSVTRTDKGTKVELRTASTLGSGVVMKQKVVREQKNLAQDELKQCFQSQNLEND